MQKYTFFPTALLALLLISAACAPLVPGSPEYAMRNYDPDFEMSNRESYDSLLRTIPKAVVNRYPPGPPPWCIDQLTGRKIICPDLVHETDSTYTLANYNSMTYKITFSDSKFPGQEFIRFVFDCENEQQAREKFSARASDTAQVTKVEKAE